MIDTKKLIVSELEKTGLKVYYEYFVNSDTPVPCVTYVEYDNQSSVEGDTLGYSIIVYHVKVWAKNIGDITKYSEQIDDIMRNLGFSRRNISDLVLDGIFQRQMKFQCQAVENFE